MLAVLTVSGSCGLPVQALGTQPVHAVCPAGDPALQERFFEVLVLDEATQAPEPAALVAAAQKVGVLGTSQWEVLCQPGEQSSAGLTALNMSCWLPTNLGRSTLVQDRA